MKGCVEGTGFNLNTLGDIEVVVEGKVADVADAMTWRDIMYSDNPNMSGVFGYLRTSWKME